MGFGGAFMHACSTFARSRWTSLFALAVLALCIGACGREPSSTGTSTSTDTKDRYDVANMKLGAPPAVVSSERHTGAFADGAALSMEPAVKPLDRTDVKEVRLDISPSTTEYQRMRLARVTSPAHARTRAAGSSNSTSR